MPTFQDAFRNKNANNPFVFNFHEQMSDEQVSNPQPNEPDEGILYHIGFNKQDDKLKKMFGDVKVMYLKKVLSGRNTAFYLHFISTSAEVVLIYASRI